ncbi:MAG: hypothetical protein COY58_05915 [Gammaproteobacteria bacterium CG_4_10_14_0_8_um_filter_38_16]|nr:MAG: hypothetical protein COY58_05915 [Gammaproteobacteria bacterium CG_4_10_14_0_8_um_filter_38_16]PJA04423.1 MAG: hypothetical protein COX72_00525 [Gammaproteobacteria bacterium CG_4_10_14_0_2_um_filter_38_22]PJB10155.1 MAG: hypothetical protein CO120_06055 [Gammaproteobacteria bacterium CG_4_9_14_3_um_filter_38_9]
MKWISFYTVVFSTALFFCFASYAAEEKYHIDPAHSFLVWHVNHLGFSNQTGKWPINGFILFDQAHPSKSKVAVLIHIHNLVTGIPALNKHLEGALFFNTTQFPTATFVSNKIILTGKNTAKIEGILTLHGISKPIAFIAKLNKAGKNPVNDKMSLGFSASTQLTRSDFDIKGFLPMISDTVKLNMDVEAQLDSK